MTGDSSRSRTSESFNKFVTRDVNNSSKIDKTSTTLIKELKNQYNEKKDIDLINFDELKIPQIDCPF